MFEVLRLLIETLTQGLPNFSSFREEKKRRELARDLFVLYIRLNKAMIAADGIVKLLEKLTESEDSWDRHFLKEQLRNAAQRQELALAKLTEELDSEANAMLILEEGAYRKIDDLVFTKSSHLDQLRTALTRGELPLSAYQPHPDEPARNRHWGFGRPLSVRIVVDISGSDRQVFYDVRTYLQSGIPQSHIADIRIALESLRTALETHFSISDVLLDVGDHRLR
jgi:hypothetical protein